MEIKWKIFQAVIDEGKFSADTTKSLLSYAESSKTSRNEIKNFLNEDTVGRVLGKQLKNNQRKNNLEKLKRTLWHLWEPKTTSTSTKKNLSMFDILEIANTKNSQKVP